MTQTATQTGVVHGGQQGDYEHDVCIRNGLDTTWTVPLLFRSPCYTM